jgi:pimeloyl-ACP methyl ester carboxylesterase
MKLRMLVVLLLLLTCRAMADGKGVAHIPLPADLTGTLNGADYKIRVPANWNGTLLVFAHGFLSTSAEVVPATTPPVSLDEQLLALGYALAGSNYRSNEKEGVLQTHALTTFFKEAVGNPSRIIIWGISFGSGVSFTLIEKYPGIYYGAVANCAPGAGSAENMDDALSFDLAYAAAFGWHDEVWGSIGDLRDGLSFANDVLPILLAEAYPGPATYGRWEFIRLVMQMPMQTFWGTDAQLGQPFFLLHMWKATERRAAAEADWGGPVAENVGMEYALSAQESQYLAALGVNAESLLAFMNARANINADVVARKHLEQWGAYSGQLRRPVLTMHAKFDGSLFVSNESYYAALVQAAGSSDKLVQSYVNMVGHCSFSADQYKSGIAAMNSWLDTGVRPDASLLPPSLGFDLGYVPPPWLF